ncbi:MAG TPA: GntR family transcriptional regulator [Actinocrinis sp.]|jgi:DNA-binding FadR family transcriptional regulator
MYMEAWNAHRVVRPSRLANAVIERLLLRILDGEFPPGGDLPPEAALAQEFAVSRTILREALKALEEKRVLRIRHGRGTTVRAKSDWNILDPLVLSVLLEYGGSPTLAVELHEVRTAIQLLMADLAARRITPEQRERLDAALLRMRHCTGPGQDGSGYREAAHSFAAVLAEASGNEVARCVVETIEMPGSFDAVLGGAPSASDESSDLLATAVRTQEFAEMLYARVLRGGPAARHSAEAAAEAGAGPVGLAGQPSARPAQLRRPGAGDMRSAMAGAAR